MAEKRQITNKLHYKGISQDDYSLEKWQVLFSTGLNLNTNTYEVTVNPEIVEWRSTNWNKMLCQFFTEDAGWNRFMWFAWENGEVYKEDWPDDVPEFIFSDRRLVRNALQMGKYIYFVRHWWGTQIKVGRTLITNTSLASITENITTTGAPLPDGTVSSKYPMYNFNDNVLIIWVGGILCTIDRNGIVTNYDIFAEDIVSITKIWPTFRIYSSRWHVAFWSFWALAIEESYQIDGFIRGAINRNSVDFVITWFNSNQSKTHLANWYQSPVIAFENESSRITERKFKTKCDNAQHLTRVWDQIYHINETDNNSDALWSFWGKAAILWDAFQEVRKIVWWSINSIFGFQWPWDDIIYMTINKGSTHKIASYSVRWTPTGSWEVTYNTMDWGNNTMEKKLSGFFITVWDVTEDSYVDVQVSFDKWAYNSIRRIISSSKVDRQEISLNANRSFTDINVRVVLNRWAILYGIRPKYEIIEE